MEKIYFISDLHIGAGSTIEEQNKLTQFFSFLAYIRHADNKLFIVGDLFDLWFEYKHVIPKNYHQTLFQLSKLIECGVEVHFLPGNHDFWILDFFQEQMGIIVHSDYLGIELQSKQLFLSHGDGISAMDKGYRLLKKIFHSPINIALYRWLHPDLGVPLAQFSSQSSRQHSANKTLNDENDYIQFALNKFKRGFDCVIIGHSHIPFLKIFDGKFFMNLGDWIRHFSYGMLSNGKLTLNYWTPKNV